MAGEAKFTSGPWTVDATTLSICRLIVTVEDVNADEIKAGDHTVAYVPTDYDTDTQHANARLIAASPDLLEALKMITAVLIAGGYDPESRGLEQCRAALTKATAA